MNTVDLFIHDYISISRNAGVTSFFYLVTTFFDFSTHFILIVLGIMILIYFVKNKIYSIFFALVLLKNTLLIFILKYLFDVTRPGDSVAVYFGQSFPSYHSAIATTFFILLMYIFKDDFSKNIRRVFNFVCLSCIFLVSVSRVYLGAHWFSDVLAGVVIGGLSTYLFIRLFERVRNRPYITSMIK